MKGIPSTVRANPPPPSTFVLLLSVSLPNFSISTHKHIRKGKYFHSSSLFILQTWKEVNEEEKKEKCLYRSEISDHGC